MCGAEKDGRAHGFSPQLPQQKATLITKSITWMRMEKASEENFPACLSASAMLAAIQHWKLTEHNTNSWCVNIWILLNLIDARLGSGSLHNAHRLALCYRAASVPAISMAFSIMFPSFKRDVSDSAVRGRPRSLACAPPYVAKITRSCVI